MALIDAETGIPLSFDFTKNYDQDVLVHHQAGGGALNAFAALKRLRLSDKLAQQIRNCMRELGSNYDAIHIRNSDYTTDWQPFLFDVSPRLSCASVLVCSDDIHVIEFCRKFFNTKKFLTSSVPPDTGGKALHTHESAMPREQRETVVRDSLVDLIALASGTTLNYAITRNGIPSGYSELAKLLHDNPSVIKSLLSTQSH